MELNKLQPVVVCGGTTNEIDASLNSGRAIASVIPNCILVELTENKLPDWVDKNKHFIVNAIHGKYGEDGGLQQDCDEKGIEYTGCNYQSSKLCINKPEAKKVMRQVCPYSISEMSFNSTNKPTPYELIEKFGEQIVIKPADQGSSIGLHVLNGHTEIANCLDSIGSLGIENWMVERRLIGREMTIGVLNGKAMGLVEIFAPNGVNNFEYKYSTNKKNIYPAPIPDELTKQIQQTAEAIFIACGCRDYARMDLILEPDNKFYFMEVNTIPGMTKTSLLPKSVLAVEPNIDFTNLVSQMIQPAYNRGLLNIN